MNSAAKLRKYGRGTATVAAAALVMTSFGPAAFAWTADPTGAEANNQALVGSIGLIDADPAVAGTQGATMVTPGGTGQAIGDIRFVIPSTFEIGDYIDFVVGPATAAAITDRISYSSVPAVTIDKKPYAASTHVNETSPTATTGDVGATESHQEVAYAGTNAPVEPTFSVARVSTGTGNFNNTIRVTFSSDSDPLIKDAKFIGAINGAKVDVGASATAGDVPVTATAYASGGGGIANPLFVDWAAAQANVTIPAAIAEASLTVSNGNVTADGSDQYVGPLVVQAAAGKNLDGGDTEISLAGAQFTSDTATVTLYNASGAVVSTTTVTPALNAITITDAMIPANTVTKIVVTNALVTAPSTATSLTYGLTSAGATLALPSTPLGGGAAPTNQTDIKAPTATTSAAAVASSLPDRLGGLDRYQTAVKIAERNLAEQGAGVGTGESDNVVIASGESFPDALSAGYLAATKKAQIILTRQGSLPQTDIEFLKNYGAKNVYIVGGGGAVGEAVEGQLRGMQSFDVQSKDGTTPDKDADGDNRRVVPLQSNLTVLRLAGADRFETNRKVNEFAGVTSVNPIGVTVPKFGEPTKKTALLANGYTPWDALAAGPLVGNSAGRDPLPIILTGPDSLNAHARAQMQNLDVEAAIMIGGTGVLPDALMGQMDSIGVYSTRLAGQDRWGTARAVAEFALRSTTGSTSNTWPGLGFGNHHPILANGGSMNGSYVNDGAASKWADALASGPFAAQTRKIIALTDSTSLPGTTKDMLTVNKAKFITSVIAVGLGNVVSTDTVKQANDAITL